MAFTVSSGTCDNVIDAKDVSVYEENVIRENIRNLFAVNGEKKTNKYTGEVNMLRRQVKTII